MWAAANEAQTDDGGATGGGSGNDNELMMGQLFLIYLKEAAAKTRPTNDQTNKVSILTAPVLIQMSRELPHAQLPIGKDGGSEHKGLVAVAGANIGKLNYHAAMHALYPEVVHSLKAISEYNSKGIRGYRYW